MGCYLSSTLFALSGPNAGQFGRCFAMSNIADLGAQIGYLERNLQKFIIFDINLLFSVMLLFFALDLDSKRFYVISSI